MQVIKKIGITIAAAILMLPLLGAPKVAVSAATVTREGIDVSGHTNVELSNKTIDFKAVKASGKQFVFLRCGYRGPTDSTLEWDSYFEANLKGALDAGLDVGVYYVTQAISTKEAVQEADATIKKVNAVLKQKKGYELTLPIVIDFEDEGGKSTFRLAKAKLSREAHNAIAEAFCNRVEANGFTAMFYTSKSNLNDHFSESLLRSKYPLWYGSYNDKLDNGNASFWQYSNKGTVTGAGKNVDLNRQYIKTISKVSKVTATPNNKMQAKITWSKVPGVYGYQIYRKPSNTNKETLLATVKGAGKLSYTDKTLKKGVTYTYRVRAMIKTNTKNYYSAFSSTAKVYANKYSVTLKKNGGTIKSGSVSSYVYGVKVTLPTKIVRKGYLFKGWYSDSKCKKKKVTAITAGTKGNKTYYAKWEKVKVTKPDLKSVTNVSKKKMKVTIRKKIASAEGYVIIYSTNSKMKSSKTVTISKNSTLSKTISGLTKGKKYYVQVRAYHKDSTGAKVYSGYSKKVSVKINK